MKSHVRAALLLAALAGRAALAESPDCPCPIPPAGPPPPWSGSAEFSYLSTSGNSHASSLGGGLELFYKPLPWTFGLDAPLPPRFLE
jgi:putative salt-induced outer membrane protein YdiY